MKKILFLFAFVFLVFISTQSASAANCSTSINGTNIGIDTSHECVGMKGYAWGADNTNGLLGGIGWVSFSDSSTTKKYNVDFDRDTWELKGYAYSENYGYIRFGGFTDSEVPSGQTSCVSNPKNANSNSSCNAHLIQNSNGGYELVGYARLCYVFNKQDCTGGYKSETERGGYDGWIGLTGSSFGVNYYTGTNEFKGFAWGGGNNDSSNSNYAQGIGWVKMDPTGGGVSCIVSAGKDCISDNEKPIVTLVADIPNPKYNQNVTLTWDISGVTSCDEIIVTSSPNNSNWTTTNPIITNLNGQQYIGQILTTTTFGIACRVDNEWGNAGAVVSPTRFKPVLTLDATNSISYCGDVELTYTVRNNPFSCDAKLYNTNESNITPVWQGTVTGNGDETSTQTVPTIDIQTNVTTSGIITWRLDCTDTTPNPDPTGSATDTTTVIVPAPVMTFSVKDRGTSSPTTITCTNTGVEITYSIDPTTVYPNSCIVSSGTGYYTDSDWYYNSPTDKTSIIADGSNHTINTGSVSQTGNLLYGFKCLQVDQVAYWAQAKNLSHSCTGGSLEVTPGRTCYEPGETVSIGYI